MSAKRRKSRNASAKTSPNSNILMPGATTPVPPQSKIEVHPYEAAGFTRGLKRGSISVGSNVPISRSSEPLAHSAKTELTGPEPSAIEKFAARSPEEKAKVFLLFSKLLAEELKQSQGTSEETPTPAPMPEAESNEFPSRPRVRTVNGVHFVTVSKPGGLTIISNAPVGPPQKKSKPDAE